MLSLEKCKKIDSELKALSDKELIGARDLLYQMGQLAFDNWIKEKRSSKSPEWVLQAKREDLSV